MTAALHRYKLFAWNGSRRERVLCVESLRVGFRRLPEALCFGSLMSATCRQDWA